MIYMNWLTTASILLLLGNSFPMTPTLPESQSISVLNNELSANETDFIAQAASFIKTAFEYDVSDIDPIMQQEGNRISIWFYPDSQDIMDNYFVQIDPDRVYPTMLYHFQYPNVEKVDIATDDTFTYDPRIIQVARDYIEEVYDVHCTTDDIKVYGYQNKVAVQFKVSEDCFFDVRFFYKDMKPTGILYLINEDEASVWLEANHGKMYYSSKE